MREGGEKKTFEKKKHWTYFFEKVMKNKIKETFDKFLEKLMRATK